MNCSVEQISQTTDGHNIQYPDQKQEKPKQTLLYFILLWRSYLVSECKLCSAKCYHSKRIGHITKIYRSKSTIPRLTHYIQNYKVSQIEDTKYNLFITQTTDKSCDLIVITLEINKVPLDMGWIQEHL